MNNSLCKDLLCIILVIGLSILLYKLFQQDEYEGQSNAGGINNCKVAGSNRRCDVCDKGYGKDYINYKPDICARVYTCANGIPADAPRNRKGVWTYGASNSPNKTPSQEKCESCWSGYILSNGKCTAPPSPPPPPPPPPPGKVSDYIKEAGLKCGDEELSICSSGPKKGSGIDWRKLKGQKLHDEKKCEVSGNNQLSVGGGSGGKHTAVECARECKKIGGEYISRGEGSDNNNEKCSNPTKKCDCICTKKCDSPSTSKPYTIYNLKNLSISKRDNCKEVSWAREKQKSDGDFTRIDGNNKHCPLIPSDFNIQNAVNFCSGINNCKGFTDYRGTSSSGEKNKVCFWKDVDPSKEKGSNTWCYIKKSEMNRRKRIKEEEEQQKIEDANEKLRIKEEEEQKKIEDANEKLRSSIGENYDKDGCAKDEKFFWNDEIIEGGDNPNYGRTLVNNMNECKIRCINNYNCAYYKYSSGKISGKHSCHIFKEPSRYSSKKAYNSKNDKICKVKHPVHKFSKNQDTIRCMSRGGEVVGTKLIGGNTKTRSKFVKTKKQDYSIEGTKNIVHDTKENCHYSCFKDDKCEAYSWIPINEEKGKCYQFDKTEANQSGFRKITLKDGGIRKGHSVLNKKKCMEDIKNKDIVKYTDILRSEFNKFPCNPLCVREKVNKDSRSSKINYQEKVIAEKISDIRYHSAFILLNDSSNEEIKGIYMIDMDDWIKERKIYLFKKSLYKKQFPNDNTFSDKYSHKITWVNQNNKGFKIIVDVERDKDDILDNVTKLRIIKNKKLYAVSDGFLKTWSDPTLTINFLGWNKGQWKSSHINMIRKIEKKITSYNYCDDKMKNGKLWTGGVNALCYFPNTKKYDSKEDVTLSSIDTLSDQKGFLRKMELCTSRDGGMSDCEILNSSPRFK